MVTGHLSFCPCDIFLSILFSYKQQQTAWPESASELYRPSDCRLSAKLVSAFADKGCRVVNIMDPHGWFFRLEPLLFLPNSFSVELTPEWTLFQTHYFSGNLVAPEIKSRPLDL
jgi:hypothetical protein